MPVTYVAEPIIEIEGQQASASLLEDLIEIEVEENIHEPGMFILTFKNDYFAGRSQDQTWRHAGLFEIGKAIKIGFIASTTQAQEFAQEKQEYILEGEITAMECNFTSESQAPMIIRGYDVSHRLWRGRYNRSFQNMTDTDIVKKIAGEVGIPTGTIDDTGGPYGYGDIGGANGYIFQQNQTNLEFLKERASRHGFELFVKDGKLNFRKPQVENSVELQWLKELHSFEVKVSSAEQVSEVEVRGWDYSKKQPIIETASKGKVFTKTDQGQGVKTSKSFKGQPPTPKLVIVDQPVSNASEAKKIAEALSNQLEGQFVQADAKAEGNPNIRPGRTVKLKDLGKYSGEYYVTASRHLFQERVYTTEFSVRGAGGDAISSLMSNQSSPKAAQTLLAGIVTDNKDPNGWGRVRVKFPTLTEDHASYWARVVAPGGGNARGVYWLPEINDEVLVAFEHGDMHRPYVLGGVWNGQDATPRTIGDTLDGGKVRLRVSKTRYGHKAWFVDEDKGAEKRGYYIQTGTEPGHWLRFNDTDKFIELETIGHHKVRLDDKNKKILIQTSGGHKCEMDDMGRKISIESTGTIDINAPQQITLKAGGSSIEITPAGITIKSTAHQIQLGGAGISVDTPGQAQVSGTQTSIQGKAAITVSAPTISLG